MNHPPPLPGSGEPSKAKAPPQPPRTAQKKDVKKSLKGVVVKKKAKPTPVAASEETKTDSKKVASEVPDSEPSAKRRKVSEVSS